MCIKLYDKLWIEKFHLSADEALVDWLIKFSKQELAEKCGK